MRYPLLDYLDRGFSKRDLLELAKDCNFYSPYYRLNLLNKPISL